MQLQQESTAPILINRSTLYSYLLSLSSLCSMPPQVYQSVMQAVETQLHLLKAKPKTAFTHEAGHAWIVDSDTCSNVGVPSPQINACCGEKGSSTCPLPPRHPTPKGGCCGVCAAGSTGDRTRDNPVAEWHPSINNCECVSVVPVCRQMSGCLRLFELACTPILGMCQKRRTCVSVHD